ncbi:MAG: hypothetical protein JXA28_13515 [Bacteroidetes bacterium]|nr:hypothetical protein [Bacteroidota bacterium]
MGSYGTYALHALKNPASLMTLGGFAMISLISGNPIPIFVGLVMKIAFVAGAPMIPAWRKRVDGDTEQRARLESENQAKELLRRLPADDQQRYRSLMETAVSIRENYARYNETSRTFLDQISERLDDMLLRYLRMLIAKNDYKGHMTETTADEIAGRIAALQSEIGNVEDRIRPLKEKQLSILEQRREKLTKATMDSALLDEQITTLEQLMQLLKEQAITMKDPEEMNAQLDSLMGEIETTEHTVTALESSFESLFDRELRAAEEEQKRLESDQH